ncbi:unnamed protein product [Amoebophrya sp. A25]|nr:unnamed protein product [Amoebophrya sp. A25]|eukprot:GSA25T00023616001.1
MKRRDRMRLVRSARPVALPLSAASIGALYAGLFGSTTSGFVRKGTRVVSSGKKDDPVDNALDGAADRVSDAASSVGETISDSDFAHAMSDAADAVGGAAAHVADGISDVATTVGETVNQGADAVSSAAGHVSDAANDAADTAAGQVAGAASEVAEQIDDVAEHVEDNYLEGGDCSGRNGHAKGFADFVVTPSKHSASICATHATVTGCELDARHGCAWAAGACVADACQSVSYARECVAHSGCHWTGRRCIMESCARHQYRSACDDELFCHWDRDQSRCRQEDVCGMHESMESCEGVVEYHEPRGTQPSSTHSPPSNSAGHAVNPSAAASGASGPVGVAPVAAASTTRATSKSMRGAPDMQSPGISRRPHQYVIDAALGFLAVRRQMKRRTGGPQHQCVWNSMAGVCYTDVCPFKDTIDDCNNHGPTHGCVWRVGDSECHRDLGSTCSRARYERDCHGTAAGTSGGDCFWNAETGVCFEEHCPSYQGPDECAAHRPWCRWSAATKQCNTDLCGQFVGSFACDAHGMRDGCSWRNGRCGFDACARRASIDTCLVGRPGFSAPGSAPAMLLEVSRHDSTVPVVKKTSIVIVSSNSSSPMHAPGDTDAHDKSFVHPDGDDSFCAWKGDAVCVSDPCAAAHSEADCAPSDVCGWDSGTAQCLTRVDFCAARAESPQNCTSARLSSAPELEVCEYGEAPDRHTVCTPAPLMHPQVTKTHFDVEQTDVRTAEPDFFNVCVELVASVVLPADGDPGLVGAKLEAVCAMGLGPREHDLCERVRESFTRQLAANEDWNEHNFDTATLCSGVAHAVQAHRVTVGPNPPPGVLSGVLMGSGAGSDPPAGSVAAPAAAPVAAGSLPIAKPLAFLGGGRRRKSG